MLKLEQLNGFGNIKELLVIAFLRVQMEGLGTINPNEFTECEINQLLWLLELGAPPKNPPNTIGINRYMF